MVRHEKGVPLLGRKLMGDGPQRRWTEASLYLDDIAKLASPNAKTDLGVGPACTVPDLPENAKTQPQRLHRLEDPNKKAFVGLSRFVHREVLSTERGQASIVDRPRTAHAQVAEFESPGHPPADL